jgi:hypothetical protein
MLRRLLWNQWKKSNRFTSQPNKHSHEVSTTNDTSMCNLLWQLVVCFSIVSWQAPKFVTQKKRVSVQLRGGPHPRTLYSFFLCFWLSGSEVSKVVPNVQRWTCEKNSRQSVVLTSETSYSNTRSCFASLLLSLHRNRYHIQYTINGRKALTINLMFLLSWFVDRALSVEESFIFEWCHRLFRQDGSRRTIQYLVESTLRIQPLERQVGSLL